MNNKNEIDIGDFAKNTPQFADAETDYKNEGFDEDYETP